MFRASWGTFAVEDLGKLVKGGLLLQKVYGGGFRGSFLQREMHAFVTAILLGMVRLDPFDSNVGT